MKRCAVYARVSTDMQGESLENQVEYALEYVHRLGEGYSLCRECIYTDFDQSGYYTRFVQRPAIQLALSDATAGKYDVIVFKEISRISRDQAEHIEIVSRFTQAGVRMIAINDNLDSDRPETLDLLGIHSVMSEMESKRISSRVSSGKKMLARRGLWVGEAPIGYQLNTDARRLEIDPLHCDTPRLIFHLFVDEGLGTLKIAEYLNQYGRLTKNGRRWSRGTVAQVLQNPAYVGDLVYGKTRNTLKRTYDDKGYAKSQGRNALPEEDWIIVRDVHQPLISRDVFEEAQHIRSRRAKKNPRKSRHPLTGILVCGYCGAGMVCQKHRWRDRVYRYYTCSTAFRFGRTACSQPNLNAEWLECSVWSYVMKRLRPLDGADVTVKRRPSEILDGKNERSRLERTLEKARLGLQRLLSDPDVPESSFAHLKLNLLSTIRTTEQALHALDERSESAQAIAPKTTPLKPWLEVLGQLDVSDLDGRRSRLQGLIDRVEVVDYEVTQISICYRLP
ncbi:recombinase family protein [Alicyclobacillus dauci]|uniref:Recombinase family protein n=1 Tax=Alicyclobacillus dauci TaxID=1475485 RepID=A0ABY6Z1T7_9BACL|nr:recombinase family protein [Alicyclobacillus dauci]WAH36553.1 recombinase family protein [Alicyclobacillus dauci]